MRVVLIGLPGVGKSTVGRALAAALHVSFSDVDDEVQRMTGQTPAQLLGNSGEAAFRVAESAALAEVLARRDDQVVATGGGVIETETSRAILQAEPCVVLLVAPLAVIAERLGDGDDRPLLLAATPDGVGALERRRRGWYEQVADEVVDSTGSVDDVVSRIRAIVVHA